MSYGVGSRHGLDPTLLWLWRRPAAIGPIRPLAWEPPHAVAAVQEMAKTHTQKIVFLSLNIFIERITYFYVHMQIIMCKLLMTTVHWFSVSL